MQLHYINFVQSILKWWVFTFCFEGGSSLTFAVFTWRIFPHCSWRFWVNLRCIGSGIHTQRWIHLEHLYDMNKEWCYVTHSTFALCLTSWRWLSIVGYVRFSKLGVCIKRKLSAVHFRHWHLLVSGEIYVTMRYIIYMGQFLFRSVYERIKLPLSYSWKLSSSTACLFWLRCWSISFC